MILKDNAHPRGIVVEVPRQPFSDVLAGIADLDLGRGRSWRDPDEVVRRRQEEHASRVLVVAATPVLRTVACRNPRCSTTFETAISTRLYCSDKCKLQRQRATFNLKRQLTRAQHRRAGHKVGPIMADCHPDRPHLAKGKCRSCYNVAWKRDHKS